jgi:hypothetical protein
MYSKVSGSANISRTSGESDCWMVVRVVRVVRVVLVELRIAVCCWRRQRWHNGKGTFNQMV